MNSAKRLVAISLATAAGLGSVAVPALAASSTHWSKSQCQAYAKKYTHASKSSKTTHNKVLKGYHCSVVIK